MKQNFAKFAKLKPLKSRVTDHNLPKGVPVYKKCATCTKKGRLCKFLLGGHQGKGGSPPPPKKKPMKGDEMRYLEPFLSTCCAPLM